MAMYNTGNPVGSTAPKDLYDNAQVLDKLVVGTDPTVVDRLGGLRISWAGMEYDFDNAQAGRTAEFQSLLDASAYIFIGDYGVGLNFTNRSQYMIRDGIAYRVASATTLPYTTTGNWALEMGNFTPLSSDNILRQELASSSPGQGSALVAYKVDAPGTAAKTVADRMAETVSVLDFTGVDPTGVANSTSGFLAAAAYPGRVVVPVGEYLLTQDVQGFFDLQNGVTFSGVGRALGKFRGFWTNEGAGADIHRLTDRVFIAEAAEKSLGVKENAGVGTWLTTVLGAGYLEREAHLLSVSGVGEYGGVFATKTSDKAELGNYGDSSIAVAGIVYNDSASPTQIGWAAYFEANRVTDLTTFGAEFAVKNLGSNTAATPFSYFGGAVGAWFAGGGDPSYGGVPANPSDTAILIGKNGASWNRGIVFGADGISGTDGVTGLGTAISFAKGQVIQWSFNDGGTARTGGEIVSEVNAPNQGQRLDFQNGSLNVKGFSAVGAPVDWHIFSGPVVPAGETACGFFLGAQAAGTGYVNLAAHGPDSNIDVLVSPKGSGILRLGYNSQAATTPGSFSATRMLQVRTVDGTTLYIPASTTQW